MNGHLPTKGCRLFLANYNIKAMEAGIMKITQEADGRVTAWYSDGSTESCMWPDLNLLVNPDMVATANIIRGKVRYEP